MLFMPLNRVTPTMTNWPSLSIRALSGHEMKVIVFFHSDATTKEYSGLENCLTTVYFTLQFCKGLVACLVLRMKSSRWHCPHTQHYIDRHITKSSRAKLSLLTTMQVLITWAKKSDTLWKVFLRMLPSLSSKNCLLLMSAIPCECASPGKDWVSSKKCN